MRIEVPYAGITRLRVRHDGGDHALSLVRYRESAFGFCQVIAVVEVGTPAALAAA